MNIIIKWPVQTSFADSQRNVEGPVCDAEVLLKIKLESDETDDAGKKEVQVIVLWRGKGFWIVSCQFNNYSTELALSR